MNKIFCTGGVYRLPEILAALPIGRATIYLKIRRGEFPAPVKLSERIAVWRGEDLLDWLNSKIGGAK